MLRKTRIIAPYSGVTIESDQTIVAGQLLQTNDPVCILVKFQPLKATIYIPETNVQDIKIGATAIIHSRYQQQMKAEATVVEKSPVIDPASGTNKLKLALKGSAAGFLPGMQVTVLFPSLSQ